MVLLFVKVTGPFAEKMIRSDRRSEPCTFRFTATSWQSSCSRSPRSSRRRPSAPRLCPPASPRRSWRAGSPTRRRWSSRPTGASSSAEQGGRLRVIKNGALLATPFVTLTVNSSGERGLLGVTFDPDFATNNFVYVYYTATTPNVHNRISRFTANGDVAVAGSEVVILDLNPLSGATNHNGGAIHFGEDGKLYAAVGDNANGANAQTLANLLGKILRINADGSIPTDNPFYGQAAGVNRAIWALGLRNPYTFSIEPVTGRMFINDVGQNTWEEINEGVAGSNYGWPDTEGPTSDPRFDPPVYAYQHGAGTPTGCAITGGAFYNPQDSSSSRPATTATTSSPTTAAAGSTSSRRRTSPRRSSPPASRRPST